MSGLREEREQRFIKIYHSYIDEIYQFIYLRTGFDSMLAEDLTQEIFLAVYKGLLTFKGLCSERTWVYHIAKNKLNDFYRTQYRSKFEFVEMNDRMTEQIEDPMQDLQENLVRMLEQETVHTCLERLSEQYRIILSLKYMDGRSVKEIASLIGKTPKATESLLQRAKKSFISNYMDEVRREKCNEEE
ncbi:RNA polymerase sigma factor [Anaerosporobacter faecicola]|uniref:RNA polymerase sigma factor n=1 Tax=Anaerosporobacter faecicola TaxID=2718714 RepID=UPI00143AB8E8|nr:RNA polymerase sigma factor [Anaerosporobacter faecicola]